MATIAIMNNKGGCGKTTTAANIGAALRLLGLDVLLLDMDGQANLTQSLGAEPVNGTAYELMKGRGLAVPVQILPTGDGLGALDIIPACEAVADLEKDFSLTTAGEGQLYARLAAYRELYDVILIDTPPARGFCQGVAIAAADKVIITVEPEILAIHGLIKAQDRTEGKDSRVLLTKYDARKSLHRNTADQIRAAGIPTFATAIRNNVALAEAPGAQLDIFRYDNRCNGAKDYAAAAEELKRWAKLKHTAHGLK